MRKRPAKQQKLPPKPRNVAAKALREGQFQPRVEPDPKAYRRRPKHPVDVIPPDDEPAKD